MSGAQLVSLLKRLTTPLLLCCLLRCRVSAGMTSTSRRTIADAHAGVAPGWSQPSGAGLAAGWPRQVSLGGVLK